MSATVDEVIDYLQDRRAATLRALRACPDTGPDYWRWQGHAEMSRQLLKRLGEERPLMPNAPKTPARSVRVPDDLWQAAKAAAEAHHVTVTDVITEALRRYIKKHHGPTV